MELNSLARRQINEIVSAEPALPDPPTDTVYTAVGESEDAPMKLYEGTDIVEAMKRAQRQRGLTQVFSSRRELPIAVYIGGKLQ